MGQKYVVLQVTLKEQFIGTGSKNLAELENVINQQAAKGYRLHTISTSESFSKGFGGGDRIQATMVFERLDNAPKLSLDEQYKGNPVAEQIISQRRQRGEPDEAIEEYLDGYNK